MNVGVLGAILGIGGAPRPRNLGVQVGKADAASGPASVLQSPLGLELLSAWHPASRALSL